MEENIQNLKGKLWESEAIKRDKERQYNELNDEFKKIKEILETQRSLPSSPRALTDDEDFAFLNQTLNQLKQDLLEQQRTQPSLQPSKQLQVKNGISYII